MIGCSLGIASLENNLLTITMTFFFLICYFLFKLYVLFSVYPTLPDKIYENRVKHYGTLVYYLLKKQCKYIIWFCLFY